jgi:hypothetical protein
MIHAYQMEPCLCRYHDGSLDGKERRRLKRHLQECVLCSRRLRELEETDALLSRARLPVAGLAPADRDQLFRAALAASNSGFHPSAWQRRWRLATSLAVVAGVFGGLAWQHQTTALGIASVPDSAGSAVVHRVVTAAPVLTKQPPASRVELHASIETPRHARRRLRRRTLWARIPRQTEESAESAGVVLTASSDDQGWAGDATKEWESAQARLLVVATRTAPVSTLNVTVSSSNLPGYAQATFTTVTPSGAQVVTQATISSCMPGEPEMETLPHEAAPTDGAPDQGSMHQQEREKSDGMD